MDRAKPPEQTDWVDVISGVVILMSGSALTLFLAGFLAFR